MAKAVLRNLRALTVTTDPIFGELMGVTVDYEVVQDGFNTTLSVIISIKPTDTPAQIRVAITTAVIADAIANGYTELTATDLIFFDLARGVGV